MALIVLPRMSPANVNTLPRQLSLGWLADAQRSPPPTLPRPTDRQTDSVSKARFRTPIVVGSMRKAVQTPLI